MSHFRTNQVSFRLVPRFREFESTNTLIGHLVLSQNVSIPFRFVAVCVWKVVVCYFGHRRIHNFRLEFVFNRKKKTNRPIFRKQITSPGTLFITRLSTVPCVLLWRQDRGRDSYQKDGWNWTDDNNTRVSSRKMGWLVWFSRLKMSY